MKDPVQTAVGSFVNDQSAQEATGAANSSTISKACGGGDLDTTEITAKRYSPVLTAGVTPTDSPNKSAFMRTTVLEALTMFQVHPNSLRPDPCRHCGAVI